MRYDSKQARFESDLGSRGNAEYVNLILPPRWGTKWEEDGLGEEEYKEGATVGIVDHDLGDVNSVIVADLGGEDVKVTDFENVTDLNNGTSSTSTTNTSMPVVLVEGVLLTNMTESTSEGGTSNNTNSYIDQIMDLAVDDNT